MNQALVLLNTIQMKAWTSQLALGIKNPTANVGDR